MPPTPPAPAATIHWNDWSADLFKRAQAEKKPILLYVRTAWSRSSLWNDQVIYGDPEVIRLVNEKWIPVKIDRDRRPDIDQRYQIAVQVVSKGEGGWPLTALLYATGDAMSGRGFVHLEDRMGKPGMRTLLDKTAEYHTSNPDKADNLRELVMISFNREREPHRPPEVTAALIEEVVSGMLKSFDRENGGFGPPPRVLMPYPIELAATLHHRTGDPATLDLIVKVLSGMERGTIHDRVDGGFHRSTSDVTWRYPEYEKLLNYNSALLVDYLLGYQINGDPDFKRVADGIVDFLLRTLRDPAGGFYVGQWAASRLDDPRGEYYALSDEEFRKAVPAGREAVARMLFNVSAEGDLVIGPPPRSLLYLTMSRKEAAERLKVPESDVRRAEIEIIDGVRKLRAAKTQPPVEKAIYVDSCSAAVAALLEAHQALGRSDALDAGLAALDRMLAAVPKDGALLHRVQPPPEKGVDQAFAMDHMMLARAALTGYEVTGSRKYLDAARDLVERAMGLFWDPADGGFFDIAADPEPIGFLAVRRRLPNDTAYPSLNSLAARVLDRLSMHTREEIWHERAQACLKGLIATGQKLNEHDAGLALAVASFLWAPPPRYVVVGAEGDSRADELAAAARHLFDPGKLVARLAAGRDDAEISRLALESTPGEAYAVICRADRCSPPVHDVKSLKEMASRPAGGNAASPGASPRP